jgi:hypothetical protein
VDLLKKFEKIKNKNPIVVSRVFSFHICDVAELAIVHIKV